MVFIKDSKKEFLDQILNKRILVFVHMDVDAVCAWKIFQHLLHCEHILYTVLPVNNKQTLEDSYNQHRDEIKNIVLINCGAALDIVDILQPPDDAVFYLIDSLRPLEVRNVYNGVQIKIIVLPHELSIEQKSVPEFDDIFEQDEEDKENSANGDDEDDDRLLDDENYEKKDSKRRRYDNEYLEKLHKKREWESKRSKILFEYYKYTFHRCSSSLIIFDLAWKTAKDNNDLLWWSIIGVTDQYINAKIDNDLYTKYVVELHSHVLRLNHRPTNTNQLATNTIINEDLAINCLRITQCDDLNMVLLRHWAIIESIFHSIDLACLFKTWTNKGKKKLNEFLADLGLPLSECKQKYAYMDNSYRNDFKALIGSEKIKEKYRYDENQLYVTTFIASFGYCNKLSGFDMAYSVQSLLENSDTKKTLSDRFIDALNCLNRENLDSLKNSIELAILYFKHIFQQIQTFIDMNQIVAAGPFLQVFLEEGSQDNIYFSKYLSSKLLARYALQSYLALTKGKKVKNLPLVICIPINDSTTLISGVPPHTSTNAENCFGLAFDEAAEKSKSRVNFAYFDTSTIEINSEDKSKFLDALVAVMQ